jgi:NADH-quinone oxidoreductase subunit J
MNTIEITFFALCALFCLVGGIITVAARNPIRSAMGLLVTILGIAGLYLMLTAEFLAAIQLIVYAGAVVILFIFVIMLLGASATSPRDARTAVPRYLGAIVFLLTAATGLVYFFKLTKGVTPLPPPPLGFGTIEGIGRELFTLELTPFELSGPLLLVAVVGAVAVARGKQVDPTLLPAPRAEAVGGGEIAPVKTAIAAPAQVAVVAKEAHS